MENQPIVANQPVLEMPEIKKNHTVLAVIISVVVTAAIAGGGVYFWQNMEIKKVQESSASAARALQQQITALQNQIAQLGAEEDQSGGIPEELSEADFRKAATEFWPSRSVQIFKDPIYKARFYYITDFDGANIWVYDAFYDRSFQKDGTINISDGSTLLFSQKLSEGIVLVGVGIAADVAERKFVFIEKHFEDTPGICFSWWLRENLSYITLDIPNPVKKTYILSDEQRASETKKVEDCQNSL